MGYQYDDAGNVLSAIDAPGNASVAGAMDAQCYRYDALRRLKTVWTARESECGAVPVSWSQVGGPVPGWTDYAYDVVGNRTSETERSAAGSVVTASTFGSGAMGPHRLVSQTVSGQSAVSFSWDAAGNRTGRTQGGVSSSFSWDAEGELVSSTAGSTSVSSVYDADGSRLVKFEGANVTVYLPGGMEVSSSSSTAVSSTRWYSFAGKTVAYRTGNGLAGVTSVVTDHQGTVIGTVHNTDWAAGVSRKRPDPFGGSRSSSSVTSQGRGFLGAVHDANALVLLNARYLDPSTGGFISMDPLLDPLKPSHANGYVYANSNPVTMSDQSGLYPISWISDGGGGKRKSGSSRDASTSTSTNKSAKGSRAVAGSGSQGCGSDWNCEIASAKRAYASTTRCSGAGRFTRCGQREYARGGVDFSYHHSWRVASSGVTTPEEAMAVFKASPDKVFPFKIEGCGQLASGSRCVLHTDEPNLPGYAIVPFDSVGTVGVDVTSTSVKFTVLSLEYFDGPGSTIEFSTSLGNDGAVYLNQTADALGGRHWMALAASPPFWIPSPAEHAWGLQADALSGLLR